MDIKIICKDKEIILENYNYKLIKSGLFQTILLGFGNNNYFQLGLCHNKHSEIPLEIKFFENIVIKKIFFAYYSSFFITSKI
jgi:hypothetical protein